MELVTTLKQLGLEDKHAKVYLAMLELGESPITTVARKANLKRPTVYLIIDELILLGLGSEIIKGKKKFYSAIHPRRLVEIARFRNKQAENILPQLVALQNTAEKPKVRMLEGIEGMHIAYEEAYASLNNKEEGLWITNIDFLEEKFPEVLKLYFKTLERLHNPAIREIVQGGEISKKYIKNVTKLKKGKNYSLRHVPETHLFGHTDQLIIGNKVMTFVFGKEIFVLIVESKDNAQTQRGMFELIWKGAEKIN